MILSLAFSFPCESQNKISVQTKVYLKGKPRYILTIFEDCVFFNFHIIGYISEVLGAKRLDKHRSLIPIVCKRRDK